MKSAEYCMRSKFIHPITTFPSFYDPRLMINVISYYYFVTVTHTVASTHSLIILFIHFYSDIQTSILKHVPLNIFQPFLLYCVISTYDAMSYPIISSLEQIPIHSKQLYQTDSILNTHFHQHITTTPDWLLSYSLTSDSISLTMRSMSSMWVKSILSSN